MTRMIFALAAMTIMVLTDALAAPVPKAPPETTSYFPNKVGAKWVYTEDGQDHTEVVTAVQKKDGTTTVTIGREEGRQTPPRGTFAVSATGVFKTGDGAATITPPLCLVKLPHKDGGEWDAALTMQGTKLMGTRTAHGPEKVQVPAGTFLAIRVESEMNLRGTAWRTTYWYAPGVGEVKMQSGKKVRELKSFTPGKHSLTPVPGTVFAVPG